MYTLLSHQVPVCFAGKDREEVEDVEKKISICVRHRMYEFLVRRDDHVLVVWRIRYRISSEARLRAACQRAVCVQRCTTTHFCCHVPCDRAARCLSFFSGRSLSSMIYTSTQG